VEAVGKDRTDRGCIVDPRRPHLVHVPSLADTASGSDQR